MNDPSLPVEGRNRVVIENVSPQVDSGRFPIKRCAGDRVDVQADCYCDGHDAVWAVLRYRAPGAVAWRETRMQPLGQDRYAGNFRADMLGTWHYTVIAWIDRFQTWRREFERRDQAQDMRLAALAGADIVADLAAHADDGDRERLLSWTAQLRGTHDLDELRALALDDTLVEIAARIASPLLATSCATEFGVTVERKLAACGAWYEIFPRSTSSIAGAHGSFHTLIERLPYIAEMGFDVLYLPPIHPIGRMHRKGRNNAVEAADDAIGSPWAIGAAEGGHKALHPQLGTMEEFRLVVAAARTHGIEIALDIALQCAPDHPYVSQHPEWFRKRADGSIQYAENPPKRYQDIYPLNFESAEWCALWRELASVIEFWIDAGIRVFRVDNPHTKPFPFWEWLIEKTRRAHADVIFLSEAFTRPKVMLRLAKLGFSQSYTYFTWRNTKEELTTYFSELALGPAREYFRPNCWPTTPDILPEYLQHGGRPAFMARAILAATLSANYGIYGPAFELMESVARTSGSEEYLDSEKYQLRTWNLGREDSLAQFLGRLNRIRRENPSLHSDRQLHFHDADDEAVICYSKTAPDHDNAIVVVVNLDPYRARRARVRLHADILELPPDSPYQMHDLLTGARYLWTGPDNTVHLDPQKAPAHIFRVRRRRRSERDFDYFL